MTDTGIENRTLTANGVRLHYMIAGAGDPVVLLHGWPLSAEMWRGVMPALAETRTVVAPDLRGAGYSDKPAAGYDKATMAEDVHALMTALGHKRYSVVGYDIGGMVAYPLAGTIGLQFNLTMEPWTDQKVREAFSYAFDRETYCTEIRNGDCSPTLTWIPEGVPGHITVDQFGFDPEAAVAALAESSYGSAEALPEIKLYYNSDDPANTERMEWVAGQYRDILGIEITLEPTEGTALVALKKDPKTFPQMSTGGWYQDYPDPQNWLSVFWVCKSTFAQRVSYCNEELDALVLKGDTTTDPVERIGYYEDAGQVLVDSIPGPFLYNPTNNFLVSPKVTGWTATTADSEWPGEFSSPTTITKSE